MKDFAAISIRKLQLFRQKIQSPQGSKGINELGHRGYVGGKWEEIGQLQFDFLVKHGLQPHHYLLDIACGSLRAGVKFIPYLETGHYLGIEKEEKLIWAGIEKELGRAIYEEKKPQLVISSQFEFEKFSVKPDYVLAQSLFTHLPPNMIHDCFKKLRKHIKDDGVFYATYFETDKPTHNLASSHDRLSFVYTRQEMERFGNLNGWVADYIGNWNHPRGQVMVQYRPG